MNAALAQSNTIYYDPADPHGSFQDTPSAAIITYRAVFIICLVVSCLGLLIGDMVALQLYIFSNQQEKRMAAALAGI
jgi:hypothetical protein